MHGQLSRTDADIAKLDEKVSERVFKYLLKGYSAERTAELTGIRIKVIRDLKREM